MVRARRGWGTQRTNPGPLQRNVFVRPRSGELMRFVQPPVHAGDPAPGEPTLGPLRHSADVRLRPGDPAPSGPPLGPVRSRAPGAHAQGNTERQVVDGLRTEVCGQQKQSNDPQQPTQPQYANYWALLTRKRHILPHPTQPQHTNYWAPRMRKQHQQEHRPHRLQKAATRRNMRREDRVTVQAP